MEQLVAAIIENDSWKVILSSGVISAMIAGGVGLWNSVRRNRLEYITAERNNWREKLKKITTELQSADDKKLEENLTEIELNLNSWGYHEKDYPENEHLNIMKDEHIWKCIQKIRTEENKEQKQSEVRRLTIFIAHLMKFDWERSKREIRLEVCMGISFVLTLIGLFLFMYAGEIYLPGDAKTDLHVLGYFVYFPFICYVAAWIRGYKSDSGMSENKLYVKQGIFFIFMGVYLGFIQIIVKEWAVLFYCTVMVEIISCCVAMILFSVYERKVRIYGNYRESVLKSIPEIKLAIYSNSGIEYWITGERYFLEKGLNFRKIYFRKDLKLPEKIMMKIEQLETEKKGIKTVLRFHKRLRYSLLRRKGVKITLRDFIQENPQACKTIVCCEGKGITFGCRNRRIWESWKL